MYVGGRGRNIKKINFGFLFNFDDKFIEIDNLKVDGDTKMGLISDIKQELRKVNALKINYTTRIGDYSQNLN